MRPKIAPRNSPSAKVIHHLDNLDKIGAFKKDSRLPTCESLAQELNVSSGTVKNVYRALAREGRIESQVGVGSFWLAKPAAATPKRALRIGITVSKQAEPDWWKRNAWVGEIFAGVLKRQLAEGGLIHLEACGKFFDEAMQEDHVLDSLDGLIVLSLPPIRDQLFDRKGRLVPHVRLNPSGTHKQCNFVSPDYFFCSSAVGRTWRQTGRRRILMIGGKQFNESASTQLRFSGLACGLGDAIGNGTELRLILPPDIETSSNTIGDSIKELIDRGWIPDAIYTNGPMPAHLAIRALTAKGLNVPEDVSVVSGSYAKLPNINSSSITSTVHPLQTVGEGLLDMILRRVQRGGEDAPAQIEPVPFSIGQTTRPEENDLFIQYNQTIS